MKKILIAALVAASSQGAARTTLGFGPPVVSRAKASASKNAETKSTVEARQAKAAAYTSVNKGIPLLEAGQLDAAIELFSKAIEQCPKLAKAYRCRGVAYQTKGSLDKATADLERAVSLEPTDANNVFPRGCLFFEKEDYRRAIEDFDFVMEFTPESSPNRALVYRLRGCCWFQLGKTIPALRDFNEAIRLNPKLAIAYRNRGELLAANGERQKAIDDLTRAMDLDSSDAWSANARAVVYVLEGEIEKGMEDCDESIRRNPSYSWAYQTRGGILLLKRNFDASIIDSTKAIELSSGKRSWPLINRALAIIEKEKYGDAIRDLEAALELEPDNETASVALAYLLAACEEEQYRNGPRAKEFGTRACKLAEWKEVQSLDVLGMACAESSDYEKAAEYAQQALQIATYLPDSLKFREGLGRRTELYRARKAFHEKASTWLQEYGSESLLLNCFGKNFDIIPKPH